MTNRGVRRWLGAFRLAAGLFAVAVGAATAEPAKPNYLPYAEFSPEDTGTRLTLKQGYNDAVKRYNEALYEYHVTLERHDQLVDAYNSSTDPAQRQQARDEAAPLRAKLAALRREITSLASAVDQAARRATAGGVSVRP